MKRWIWIFNLVCFVLVVSMCGCQWGKNGVVTKDKDTEIDLRFTYKDKDGYFPLGNWKKTCWMRALKKLEELKKDKDVVGCKFVYGTIGSTQAGHTWVMYIKKENNKRVKYIYDPTYDEYITEKEFNYGYVFYK